MEDDTGRTNRANVVCSGASHAAAPASKLLVELLEVPRDANGEGNGALDRALLHALLAGEVELLNKLSGAGEDGRHGSKKRVEHGREAMQLGRPQHLLQQGGSQYAVESVLEVDVDNAEVVVRVQQLADGEDELRRPALHEDRELRWSKVRAQDLTQLAVVKDAPRQGAPQCARDAHRPHIRRPILRRCVLVERDQTHSGKDEVEPLREVTVRQRTCQERMRLQGLPRLVA